MAVGSGLGGLIPVVMSVFGILSILKARAGRRRGEPEVDEDFERRKAAAHETERRMAAYLAGRDAGQAHAAPEEREQEIRR